MPMPPKIAALVFELEQISKDKITQPAGASRRTAGRAARLIQSLYENVHDESEIEESEVDRRTARR
jgi:hypothetical protein